MNDQPFGPHPFKTLGDAYQYAMEQDPDLYPTKEETMRRFADLMQSHGITDAREMPQIWYEWVESLKPIPF